jgi:hypothetical protein
MKKFTFLTLSILMLILYSCNKKDNITFLSIKTSSYEITGDSIKLIGEFISLSDETIVEFGFVMDKSSLPDYNTADSIFLIKGIPKIGIFSHSILSNFDKETKFHIRFFAKTLNEIIYGESVVLYGNGKIAPVISGFSPKAGTDGDIVKIYGKYFRSGKYILIYLGNEQLEVVEWNDENILVKIPDYQFREELAFKIILNSHSVVSDELFLLKGPYIKSFTPSVGGNISEIALYGEGFSIIPWHNEVFLGTEKAEIIASTGEELKIKLDTRSIVAGSYHFMVNSDGKSSISDSIFVVISPWAYDSKIPIEEGLEDPVTLSYNNKIYLITGTTDWSSHAGFSQYVLEYDLNTRLWSQKSNFPGERRSGAAGFVINGKAYVGTGAGYDSPYILNDFWEYDFQSGQWTRKNDFPGGYRIGILAFTYNGSGYFLMGSNTADFWKYNHQDDSWIQLPSFEGDKNARTLHLIVGDVLYIITLPNENNPFEGEIWKFNFFNNQWSFVNILYDYLLKIFNYKGKTYILKYVPNTVVDVTEIILFEFDIETGKVIRQFEAFPGQYRSMGSFAVVQNDQLYFGCGGTGGLGERLNDVWIYPLSQINK